MVARLRQTYGVTLVELMVTVAILSIGVLAGVASFRYITTSIQNSKARTLANNLDQEQIEKLKNLSYYSLLITTSVYSDNRFNPPLSYDTGNYPIQTIIQGGIPFQRANRVDFVYQNGTTISAAPWTSDDTGMKEITTYVMWQDANGWEYREMHNLMANPAANPLNSSFSGSVKDNNGNIIPGAFIQVLDYPDWFGFANAAGNYQFRVSAGSYTVECSSQGYFTNDIYLTVQTGQNQPHNFVLGIMSSGTATGSVYLDNHLVISQVVATTGTTNDLEYVELYNPTTSSIYIGDNLNYSAPNVVPIAWDNTNTPSAHRLIYISSSVAANGYYLITNTGNGSNCTAAALIINGTTINPDACWRYINYPSHALAQADAGGISIGNSNSYLAGWAGFNWANWPAARIDSLGWSKNASGHGAPSSAVEGSALSNGGGSQGLQPNEQYVRMSAPGSLSSGIGRAYDANNNNTDFFDFTTIIYPPYDSINIQAPITGTPATGAYITFNDGLSQTATCKDAPIFGIWDACSFSVPGIATGTWTMVVSSNSYYQEISTVTMTPNLSTGVPNGSTYPIWPSTNLTNTLLSITTNYAFVSGVVTNVNGAPLPGIRVISGQGTISNTNSSGRYFLSVATGDAQITANPNSLNKAYSSAATPVLTALIAGQLVDNQTGSYQTWLTLPLTGSIQGYFQTGSLTPLPGRTAVALLGGNQVGQAVSDNSGNFYLNNLATGTYTIQPSLDPAEQSNPINISVTLVSTGAATSVSTFTVTSGLSQITGQVLVAASSQPITTGVLVLASTTTLSGGSSSPPPTVNGATGVLCNPCYYAASSDSTGQYALSVRSSTSTYQLYGWYTKFSGTTPSTTRQGPYAVNVSSAGQILSQSISW